MRPNLLDIINFSLAVWPVALKPWINDKKFSQKHILGACLAGFLDPNVKIVVDGET